MNNNNEEHKKIIDEMLDLNYKKILDLGSGKTSMSLLLNKFLDSNITGICYPGDNRKLDRIKSECIGNYLLIEKDICEFDITDNYDLVLCHLLFGEALKFGNKVDKMARQVFKIDTKDILVIDYLEDISNVNENDLKGDSETKSLRFFNTDELPENLIDYDLIKSYLNYLKRKIR